MADITLNNSKLYTIGYGNRSPEQLFDLVKTRGCSYLIDVRSIPYSSYHKAFNKEAIATSSEDYGLKYLYLGEQLGGKPSSDDLDEMGRADYVQMAEKTAFLEALERLHEAENQGLSVALMCAELRPETCHRTKLIGEALARRGITLYHIDEQGGLVDQKAAMQRLTGGQNDLFD